jgi:hypothetical protein
MNITSLTGSQHLGFSKCKYFKTYFCEIGHIFTLQIEAIGGSI